MEIFGSESADEIHGTRRRDVIYAGAGNDIVHAGNGVDLICGGSDDDQIWAGKGMDLVRGQDGDDRLKGGRGADELVGGGGSDHLSSGAERDDLLGGAGNDSLNGGKHSDLLLGGSGNDELDGGDGNQDFVTFAFAKQGVAIDLGGGSAVGEGTDSLSSIEWIEGSPADDELVGSSEHDTLFGGDGADSFKGAEGRDTITGGDGDDSIDGGDGKDMASFLTSSASLTATIGNAAKGQGNDTLISVEQIEGSSYGDKLTGGPEDDVLVARRGPDLIFGGDGDDLLGGGDGSDRVNGEEGDDLLSALYTGRDVLDGGPGTDTCELHADKLISCEEELSVIGAPFTMFVVPREGRQIDRADLHNLRGWATGGGVGHADGVQVAVRRVTRLGCLWLRMKQSAQVFVRRPCSREFWNSAVGLGTWKLKLARRLPPGAYQAISRAVAKDGSNEFARQVGSDVIDFVVD